MQDIQKEQNLVSLGHQQQWKDIEGNPTDNENITHWDENGFLEIREELEEEIKTEESKTVGQNGQFGSVVAPKNVNEDELDDFARMQRKFYGLDQGNTQKPIKI